MKKKFLPYFLPYILVGLVVSVCGVFVFFKFLKNNHPNQVLADAIKEEGVSLSPEQKTELEITDADAVLGSKDAKITLISYDSFSCFHCATFYNIAFPDIYEKYIKTGKVKFIHRDLPIDDNAKHIAQIFKCIRKDARADFNPERYYRLITSFYKNQSSLLVASDFNAAIKDFFVLAGTSKTLIESCFTNSNYLEEFNQSNKNVIEKLALQGTPTFYINQALFTKSPSYRNFEEEFENILNNN